AAVADAEVVVYYSGNDGMLRAINGNRTGNISTFTPGQEIWSFVAPEFLQGITRNYNNTTIVSYPANTTSSTSTLTIGTGSKSLTVGTNLPYSAGKSVRISYDTSNLMQGTVTSYSASTGALVVDVTSTDGSGSYSAWKVELGLPKNYAIDGPITAWQGVVGSSGSKVFLYAGMRRGGRALYAFDVTNKTTPSLKWKRGCPNLLNDTDCTNNVTNGDWRGIGQTWSPATLVKVQGYSTGGNPVPLLLMGGGYDDCEDTDGGASGGNHSCSTTKGNQIYVINSDTGAILQSFSTLRAVVGAITPVPDSNGFMQYAYAADAGGNLYRLSGASAGAAIGTTTPGTSAWTLTHIAALGCDDGSTTCARNRKFLFGPDVVEVSGGYALLVGSGDREKPLGSGTYGASNAVSNNFFRVTDQPTNASWLSSESGTCGAARICRASLTAITTSANPSSVGAKGWYLGLASTENVVTSAITVSDNVTFSTFKPAVYDANACSGNLGEANVYNVNLTNAAPPSVLQPQTRFQRITGDGLPPSPVAGRVRLDDGTTVPFLIGGSKDSALEGMAPYGASSVSFPKSRSHWYIKQ
ncbi:MAG: hypothetical protein ACKPE6_18060, partial [Gammaproteobacteria bacterium]